MGFRYRKSIRIFPWVRLNITIGGISLTFGPRGKTISIGSRGVYGNLRIGKGLSYRTRLMRGPPHSRRTRAFHKFIKLVMTAVIISFALYQLATPKLDTTSVAEDNISKGIAVFVEKGVKLLEDKIPIQRSSDQNEEL